LLQKIVDPSSEGVSRMPTKPEDLAAVLSGVRTKFFDNRGEVLTDEMSEVLCLAVTGATFSGRQFHTHDERYRIPLRAAICMTAIENPVSHGDLMSRVIVIKVDPPPRDNLPETLIHKEDALICAGMVAMLADGVSAEIRNAEKYLDGLGRMADFEASSRAAAEAFDWSDIVVAPLFQKKASQGRHAVAEASTLISALDEFMRRQGGRLDDTFELRTTPYSLHKQLAEAAPFLSRDPGFPKASNAMMRQINANAAVLAEIGITVTHPGREIVLSRKVRGSPDRTSPSGTLSSPLTVRALVQPSAPCPGYGGDGWWRGRENPEWSCKGCEPMPPEVHDLEEWPPRGG
jgi:hypothetical protein